MFLCCNLIAEGASRLHSSLMVWLSNSTLSVRMRPGGTVLTVDDVVEVVQSHGCDVEQFGEFAECALVVVTIPLVLLDDVVDGLAIFSSRSLS